MRTHAALLSLSLLSTIVHGQNKDHVQGTGDVVKGSVIVPSFHGIVVQGAIDVVLTPAAPQQVQVEAQANIADLLTTEVKDGIWIMGTSKNYSTNKPFVVRISSPGIDRVHIEGSGDVKGSGPFSAEAVKLLIEGSGNIVMGYSAKTMDVEVQGSGDVELSGDCAQINATVQGSGDVNAADLKVANARVEIQGSGNITLNVGESLAGSIAGSGNVTYKGSPASVKVQVAGSGEVRSSQ